MTGERDLQVPPAENMPAIEKALTAGGNMDYRLVRLPKLNHLLQTSQTGLPQEYAKIDETLAPVVLETIVGWIQERTKAGS